MRSLVKMLSFLGITIIMCVTLIVLVKKIPTNEYCVSFGVDNTICGELQVKGSKTLSVFKGIRYATAKRWSPSVITEVYEQKIRANKFGAICPQVKYSPLTQSEDCLFLNIWTPDTKLKPKSNLPVMVFIHGGEFLVGSGNENVSEKYSHSLLYDGLTFAAEHDVILVTLNYRLGALGFIQIGQDGRYDASSGGNYGIQDQVTALKWIQKHITKFGGNPNNVTIFGESTGAMSVGLLLWSTSAADDYFEAAIMESNPLGYIYRDEKDALYQSDSFLSCLKTVKDGHDNDKKCKKLAFEEGDSFLEYTTSDILEAQELYIASNYSDLEISNLIGLPKALPFAPIIDGEFLKKQPLSQVSDGSPKPLLFGFNQDEGIFFAQNIESVSDSFQYNSLIKNFFTCASDEESNCQDFILSIPEYSSKTDFTQNERRGLLSNEAAAFSNLINNFSFSCANMAIAPSVNQTNIWAYYFTQPDEVSLLPDLSTEEIDNVCGNQNQWGNSCHAAELPFVFNSLPPTSDAKLLKFGLSVNSAWASFAKNYNTTGPGAEWKKWQIPSTSKAEKPRLNIMTIDGDTVDDNIFRSRHCDKWLSEWLPKDLTDKKVQNIIQSSIN